MAKRSYRSPARIQQADETKQRIVTAAHNLLSREGFAAMTVNAVAKAAGVSTQSVYAIFGSKTGLLDAVIDVARFGDRYRQLVAQALGAEDPLQRLRFAAAIARQIYDSEQGMIELMGGAGVVSPDLANKMKHREMDRRTAQSPVIDRLEETGRLKPGLNREKAADILWALTGRDLYRLLVQIQGWPADQYQEWLADSLIAALSS